METSRTVSYKVKHILPYDTEIPLLSIYPKEIKSYAYPRMCMQMFIAVLLLIVQN